MSQWKGKCTFLLILYLIETAFIEDWRSSLGNDNEIGDVDHWHKFQQGNNQQLQTFCFVQLGSNTAPESLEATTREHYHSHNETFYAKMFLINKLQSFK